MVKWLLHSLAFILILVLYRCAHGVVLNCCAHLFALYMHCIGESYVGAIIAQLN